MSVRFKSVTSVAVIIVASFVYLLFVFDGVYNGSRNDILGMYQSIQFVGTRSVAVNSVAKVLEVHKEYLEVVSSTTDSTGYVDEEDSSSESLPINIAGQSSATHSGTYPWFYHQKGPGCSCNGCGEWNSRNWGWTSPYSTFAKNGCAIYSMSMAVSHLTNSRVTPHDVLLGLGATLQKSNGVEFYALSGSGAFAKNVNVKRDSVVSTMASKYGLSYHKVSSREEVKEVLNNGGLVWCMVNSTSKWTRSTHFVTLYGIKTDNGKDVGYYAYNSTDTNYANNYENIDTFWNAVSGPLFAIY